MLSCVAVHLVVDVVLSVEGSLELLLSCVAGCCTEGAIHGLRILSSTSRDRRPRSVL